MLKLENVLNLNEFGKQKKKFYFQAFMQLFFFLHAMLCF